MIVRQTTLPDSFRSVILIQTAMKLNARIKEADENSLNGVTGVQNKSQTQKLEAISTRSHRSTVSSRIQKASKIEEVSPTKKTGLQAQPLVSGSSINASRLVKQAAKKSRRKINGFGDEVDHILAKELAEAVAKVSKSKKNQAKTGISQNRPSTTKAQSSATAGSHSSDIKILNYTRKAGKQPLKIRESLDQTKPKRFKKGQQENKSEVSLAYGNNSHFKHNQSGQEGFSVFERDVRVLQPLDQQLLDKVQPANIKINKCVPPESTFQGGFRLKRDLSSNAVQRQSNHDVDVSSQEELQIHKKSGFKRATVSQICGPASVVGSQNLNNEKLKPFRKALDQRRVSETIVGASKTVLEAPKISVFHFRNQVPLAQQRVSAPSSAALDGCNGELKLTDQESQRDEEELRRIADNAPRKLVYEQENETDAVLKYTNCVYDQLKEEAKKQPEMPATSHDVKKDDVYMTESSHTVSENLDDQCQDIQEYLNDQEPNLQKIDGVYEASPELLRNFGAIEQRATNRNVVSQKTPPQIYNNIFQSNTRSEEFYLTTKAIIERRQLENPNIYKTGPTKYQDGANKGHWTPEEDAQLTKAVEKFKSKNWKKIAECLTGRTDVQCLHRWQKVLNPELVKGPWSKEEDKLVLSLVQARGAQKWTSIAEYLPGRIGKQCRERWHNHLNPRIKKNEWSLEEELILFIQNRKKENKWAEIAQTLEGRTDNTIKNHWNSSMKKKIFDMKCQTEKRFKKRCEELKIKYIGCYPEPGMTFPASYKKEFEQFEEKLLKQLIQTVKNQNIVYFQEKARDLLTEKDPDGLNLQTAQLLIESLNMKLEDFLTQQSHSRKNFSASTAHGTTVQRATDFSQKRQNDVNINPFTCLTTLSSKPTERDESAIGKGTSAFNIPTQASNISMKQATENPEMQTMAVQPSSSELTRKNSTVRGRGRPRSNKNEIPHENFNSSKQPQAQSTKRMQQAQQAELQSNFSFHRSPKTQDLEHHQQNSKNHHKSPWVNLPILNESYNAVPTGNSRIDSAAKQQSYIHGKNPMLPLSSLHQDNHIFNMYDYDNFNNFLSEDPPQIHQTVEPHVLKSHHLLFPVPIQHQFSFGPPQMTLTGHQGGGNILPSQLHLYQQNNNSQMLAGHYNHLRFNGNSLISQGNQHQMHNQLHPAMMLDSSPNKVSNEAVLDCHDLISQPMNKNGSLMFEQKKQQVSSPNSQDLLMEAANSVRKQSQNISDPNKGGETKIKITENPTVAGTSPEMFKTLLCVKAKKNSPTSGRHMKNSNCLQLDTPQQGDPSNKSKQSSAQHNSISAFKPFGNNSSASPMDLVAGNNDAAQHHTNIMISQFQGGIPPHQSMSHGHPQDDFMHPSIYNNRLSHFAGEEAPFGMYSNGSFMRYGQQHQPQFLQQHLKHLQPHQMNFLIPTMVFNSVRRDSLLNEGIMGNSSFSNGNNIASLFQAVPRRQDHSMPKQKILPNLSTTKLVQNKQNLPQTFIGKSALSLNVVREDSQSSGQKTSEHVQQSFKPTIILHKSPSMLLAQNKYTFSQGQQQPQEKDVMMVENAACSMEQNFCTEIRGSPKQADLVKRQKQVCKFISSSCSKKSCASSGGSPKEQISPQE